MSYPSSIGLHASPLQNPKTPKSIPAKEASGIILMIGVETIEIMRRPNAPRSRIVSGVAGLNILQGYILRLYARRQDETRVVYLQEICDECTNTGRMKYFSWTLRILHWWTKFR